MAKGDNEVADMTLEIGGEVYRFRGLETGLWSLVRRAGGGWMIEECNGNWVSGQKVTPEPEEKA